MEHIGVCPNPRCHMRVMSYEGDLDSVITEGQITIMCRRCRKFAIVGDCPIPPDALPRVIFVTKLEDYRELRERARELEREHPERAKGVG